MTVVQGQSPFIRMKCDVEDGILHCRFSGRWTIEALEIRALRRSWRLALSNKKEIQKVLFELGADIEWDSALVVFIRSCLSDCKESKLSIDISRLPSGLRKLFLMAEEKSIEKVVLHETESRFLTVVGERVIFVAESTMSFLRFLGEWILSLFRLFGFKARFRLSDFVESCRACGVSALPIVTLVSFLTGLTMAFVGSVQLSKFNARIYVADLVSLAMVREMATETFYL